eukprot:XP_028338918.1 erythroferrone isoform X3 [Physeter catodon]
MPAGPDPLTPRRCIHCSSRTEAGTGPVAQQSPSPTCSEALHPVFLHPCPGASSPAKSRLWSGLFPRGRPPRGRGPGLCCLGGRSGGGPRVPEASPAHGPPAKRPGEAGQLMAVVFQEPTVGQVHGVDPRDAWMLFVRQSDKGVNSKKGSRGKAKKLKLGLPGPPGPPGPQGPPGPITPPEVLLKEFQLLLKAPWRLSWGWRAAASSSPSRSTACCICRRGSTPPSSWTMPAAPPSQCAVAPTSVLSSSVYDWPPQALPLAGQMEQECEQSRGRGGGHTQEGARQLPTLATATGSPGR